MRHGNLHSIEAKLAYTDTQLKVLKYAMKQNSDILWYPIKNVDTQFTKKRCGFTHWLQILIWSYGSRHHWYLYHTPPPLPHTTSFHPLTWYINLEIQGSLLLVPQHRQPFLWCHIWSCSGHHWYLYWTLPPLPSHTPYHPLSSSYLIYKLGDPGVSSPSATA